MKALSCISVPDLVSLCVLHDRKGKKGFSNPKIEVVVVLPLCTCGMVYKQGLYC